MLLGHAPSTAGTIYHWQVAQALVYSARNLLEHLHLVFGVSRSFASIAKGAVFGSLSRRKKWIALGKHFRRNLESLAQFRDVGLVEDAFLVQNFGHDTFEPKIEARSF